jgi:hypothetical protein
MGYFLIEHNCGYSSGQFLIFFVQVCNTHFVRNKILLS